MEITVAMLDATNNNLRLHWSRSGSKAYHIAELQGSCGEIEIGGLMHSVELEDRM